MKIQVLYFAYCRDLMGRECESVVLREDARVSDVVARCIAAQPAMGDFAKHLLVAVNQEYARPDHRLADGDEVAIFPPVSGGSADEGWERDHYEIVHQPIRAQEIVAPLKRPEDGAVVTFDGIIRDNSRGKPTRYVEYHAYEPMALKHIRRIGERIREMWEIDGVAIIHRLGRLEIGESSVLIVVTAAHRRPAFEACQYAIDALKKTVPIWKKECYADDEVWIEGDVPVKSCHEH